MSWLIIPLFVLSATHKSVGILQRSPRSLTFPQNGSATGLFVALLLPLQSSPATYTSFLIEANIFLPESLSSNGEIANRWDGRRRRSPTASSTERRSVAGFTRWNVYRAIDEQLDRRGLNGTACLLQTICHTAAHELYENNGWLGNLFHILFTPTASRDEGLPQMFYDAEDRGRREQCELYYPREYCAASLLDMILGDDQQG